MAKKSNYMFNEDGTITFRIAEIGARSRTTYEGVFKVKSGLSPFDELAAGRDMRTLLGDHGVQALDHEVNVAYGLSQLRQRIIDAPDFWTSKTREGFGGADIDANIIIHVLNMSIEAEVQNNKRLKEEAKKRLKQMAAALDEHDAKEAAEGAEDGE